MQRIAEAATPNKTTIKTASNSSASTANLEGNENTKPGFLKRTFGWLGGSKAVNEDTAEVDAIEASKQNNDDDKLKEGQDWRDKHRNKSQSISYDDHFRKYTKHYFGIGSDWRWFQAQAMVESEMKSHVRSSSGAMGLMQIMPRTFQEIRSRNPTYADPFDPHYSIAAGIYYNRQLYKSWAHVENEDERRKFMFASYNAGLGNVRRAAKRVGNPVKYQTLEPALSAEPKHYVIKIERERRKIGD
ncbi:MAG: transglycosylase SLT domain-containing protein [Pseudomonadota bacterium]